MKQIWEKFRSVARKFKWLIPIYHWLLSFSSAVFYRFPSRKIFVLGVTGTKGKTSVIEIINAIFEEAGYKTALSSSLRFKVGDESEKNDLKMTMPGRFFMQKFLRRAVNEKCQYAFLEMTSEGAVQHRHKFIQLNAMIFTNLSPEHIESHGSFENYRDAKLSLFKALEKSSAKRKIIIVNEDDQNASYFLNFNIAEKIKYSLKQLASYNLQKDFTTFAMDGLPGNKTGAVVKTKLAGEFNLYNILSAIAFAKSQNIGMKTIKDAVEKFTGIGGRLEKIELSDPAQKAMYDFTVVVDYAHTPDSLEKVYEVFQTSRKICVLGSAGGGRDKWKRPEMGTIASKHCDQIILTNEDPYDDDPLQIVDEISHGISRNYEIIIDRREAIAKAISYAKTGDTVIITGKGAEPWIMGPKGTKLAWDDRDVAREGLEKILNTQP